MKLLVILFLIKKIKKNDSLDVEIWGAEVENYSFQKTG